MEPNGTVRYNENATENIYELTEVDPKVKKDPKSFNSLSEDVKTKVVVSKKMKSDFRFNIFITIFSLLIFIMTLSCFTFFLVHYFFDQPQEIQQSVAIESLQLQLNSSIQEGQFHSAELTRAYLLLMALQQTVNNSNEYGEMSLQNYIQIFEQKVQTLSDRIQNLEQQLNNSGNEIRMQVSVLQDHIQHVDYRHNRTNNIVECSQLNSCKGLPPCSPSGYYPITVPPSNVVVQVYCDTALQNCNSNTIGGWMRVANLDMTDPLQQCPVGFKQITRTEPPLRTCGRPDSHTGCVSTVFPVHGIEYSRVCGRIIGYQIGTPDAFYHRSVGIDSYYVCGISLTHGQPRQHIWTFANALAEETIYVREICPCSGDGTFVGSIPSFVGEDYFCDTAIRGGSWTDGFLYPNDPLWNGQGCGSASTCCQFNNPPWFCKQLPQPTTDDIELRLCEFSRPSVDDSPIEIAEIYVN